MPKFLLFACLALVTLPGLAQPIAAAPPPAAVAPSSTLAVARGADAELAPSADIAMRDKASALAAQLDRLLAPSRSPRDQALRWDLSRWQPGSGMGASAPRASLHDAAAHAASDRLVQWLWARATAAEIGCVGARACPARARALAKLEPGNGAAWLPVLEQAWDDEDEAAMDAALSHIAMARAFDDLFIEYAGALAEVENRFPAYVAARSTALAGSAWAGSSAVASIMSASALSAASAIPSMATLADVCDRGKHPQAPAARFVRCGAIGHLMLGKATTVLSRSVGVGILRRSGQLTASDQRYNRNIRWIMQQSAELHSVEKDPRAFSIYFADLVRTGDERTAMQRQIARAGMAAVPPAGWKAPGEE